MAPTDAASVPAAADAAGLAVSSRAWSRVHRRPNGRPPQCQREFYARASIWVRMLPSLGLCVLYIVPFIALSLLLAMFANVMAALGVLFFGIDQRLCRPCRTVNGKALGLARASVAVLTVRYRPLGRATATSVAACSLGCTACSRRTRGGRKTCTECRWVREKAR